MDFTWCRGGGSWGFPRCLWVFPMAQALCVFSLKPGHVLHPPHQSAFSSAFVSLPCLGSILAQNGKESERGREIFLGCLGCWKKGGVKEPRWPCGTLALCSFGMEHLLCAPLATQETSYLDVKVQLTYVLFSGSLSLIFWTSPVQLFHMSVKAHFTSFGYYLFVYVSSIWLGTPQKEEINSFLKKSQEPTQPINAWSIHLSWSQAVSMKKKTGLREKRAGTSSHQKERLGVMGKRSAPEPAHLTPFTRASLVQNHMPLINEEWKKEPLRPCVSYCLTTMVDILWRFPSSHFSLLPVTSPDSHGVITLNIEAWVCTNLALGWRIGYYFPSGFGVWLRDGKTDKISNQGESHYFWGCHLYPAVLEPEGLWVRGSWNGGGEYLTTGSQKTTLICSICQFVWWKHFHHADFKL